MLFISQTNILAKSLSKRPDMTMKTPFILILSSLPEISSANHFRYTLKT